MAKTKDEPKMTDKPTEEQPTVESTEEKPTGSGETKGQEPTVETKTLSLAVNELESIQELASVVQSKMDSIGYTPIPNVLSSIVASMSRITSVEIGELSTNVGKLMSVYPKVLGIWSDPARDQKSKLVGIASAFESVI